MFKVGRTSVISGEPVSGPLSAVDPSSLDKARDAMAREAAAAVMDPDRPPRQKAIPAPHRP